MRILGAGSLRELSCPWKLPRYALQQPETGPEPIVIAMENPSRKSVRSAVDVLRVWRALTFRQWAWTTGIALVLILAQTLGILPLLLSMGSSVHGPQPS